MRGLKPPGFRLKLFGFRFLKIGSRIYITDGNRPIRYFDLKRFRTVVYKSYSKSGYIITYKEKKHDQTDK